MTLVGPRPLQGPSPQTVASSAPPKPVSAAPATPPCPFRATSARPCLRALKIPVCSVTVRKKVTDRSKMGGGPNSFPLQPDAASSTTLYDAPQLLHTCQPPLCHAEIFHVWVLSPGRAGAERWCGPPPGRCPPAHPGPNGRAWRPPSNISNQPPLSSDAASKASIRRRIFGKKQ